MAIPDCFPDTMTLTLEVDPSCCLQLPSSQEITLNRVYGSQVYWNSIITLECWGFTTSPPAFFSQFHLFCQRGSNDEQIFKLYWCFDETVRQCAVCLGGVGEIEFTLVSSECDPIIVEFTWDGNPSPCCAPPDEDDLRGPFTCVFTGTVTE